MMHLAEKLTIMQVANGWVIHGKTPADVLHVAVTPESLGEAVVGWARTSMAERDPGPPPNGKATSAISAASKGA